MKFSYNRACCRPNGSWKTLVSTSGAVSEQSLIVMTVQGVLS